MAQTQTVHATLHHRPMMCGATLYIAAMHGEPVAETVAFSKRDAKEALNRDLAEKFAPGKGIGCGVLFRVVWH